MNKHENAIKYITRLIKKLEPTALVEVNLVNNYIYHFNIEIRGQGHKIEFGGSLIDDFENVIKEHPKSDQYYALQNSIKFKIYISLGQEGLITNFSISLEILNEKRDWLTKCSYNLKFDDWVYEIFYSGLRKASAFLNKLIKKYHVESAEIKEEKGDIDHLIKYYEKNKTFTMDEVSAKYLGHFKAAAIFEIIDKEKSKKGITISTVLKDTDKKIYPIVSILRQRMFPQIKIPKFVHDYVEYTKIGEGAQTSSPPSKELIFIACGQRTHREKALGEKIKKFFTERKINFFLAEAASDLEDLNSHIFRNLTDCTGFIAILHKREKINKEHITSVWVNQEVAVTAYLRFKGKEIPTLILYEKGTEREGLIKYTIANPKGFSSDEEVLSEIEKWIKSHDFNYVEKLPEFDIVLGEQRKQFGSSSGGGRNGYFNIRYALSFRIRNKSNVNICMEDIKAENNLLGRGQLDKTNPRLTRLPFNIGPRITEEVHLCIIFPNEVSLDRKEEDFKLQIEFEFADWTIKKELIGYL